MAKRDDEDEPKKKSSGKNKSGSSGKSEKKSSRRESEASDESDVAGEEEEFVQPDEAAEMLDAAVKKTPWFFISIAFHVLVLASLGLITFATVNRKDSEAVVTITVKPTQVAKIEMPDRPRGV